MKQSVKTFLVGKKKYNVASNTKAVMLLKSLIDSKFSFHVIDWKQRSMKKYSNGIQKSIRRLRSK